MFITARLRVAFPLANTTLTPNPVPPRLAIPKAFFEKSDVWGARACVRLLGVPLVLITSLPLLASISPWLALAAIAPLGIAISKTTLLVHEAVHGHLFRTPWLNGLIGRVGGWWTAVDFVAFDALHRQHHARVGAEGDPQRLDYAVLHGATRAQLAWHLLRPLIGWNVRHMATLVRQRMRMKRAPWVALGEVSGLVTVQAGFALLATAGGQTPWLALIFPTAAATVGLFMSQIRGFCEHVPMPGEAPGRRLRSHTSNPVERQFLHYMNYNYHGEHHRFPRVPSRNLPALSRWLEQQGQPMERSASYLATLTARWRAAPTGARA
ncbi:MAG: fatty acid desaturase [Proteobacteria bacterium]|nr:fatty acid desaturase [Burkholderiales bacterium]